MLHMYADLVCPSCFKPTFYEGYIAESFYYFVVCYSMFCQRVFPSGNTVNSILSRGSRAERLQWFLHLLSRFPTPVRCRFCLLSCQKLFSGLVLASGVFASSTSPEVSLSIRCTNPTRESLASKPGTSFRWKATACSSVPSNFQSRDVPLIPAVY